MKTISVLVKFVLIIFISLLLSINLFSQEDTIVPVAKSSVNKKHEINIGYSSFLNTQNNDFYDYLMWYIILEEYYDISPSLYFYYLYSNPLLSTQYGLGYKYHFSNNAIRTYIEFGAYNDKQNRENTDESLNKSTSEASYKINNAIFRAGYQKSVGKKNVKLLFGFDLFFQCSSQKYKYKLESVNIQSENITKREENMKLNYNGYGGSPIIGINIFVSEGISLSTETRLNCIYYIQKGKSDESYINDSYISNDESDFENKVFLMNISPFGIISLNIHL
ncbi:MAG: hypothetical protein HY738_09090 [Bacteroidia bacterium]|nr:hypothetical protein [Bacteroidia bacterium]